MIVSFMGGKNIEIVAVYSQNGFIKRAQDLKT
jgi:hypothetical protein